MAYRLGMTWTDFQLDKGIMRAVGEGKSFSTSIVRGMGLVVEYSTSKSYQRHEHRIPDKVADQVCTYIPTVSLLFSETFCILQPLVILS
jgi:hypothetical protein